MAANPVVVGVDGSEESLRAVEWAALEARRHSVPLRILSAPALVPRVHAPSASPEEIACALRGIAARALDAAITRSEEVAPGLPLTTGLLSGPPALAVAESGAGASMLVVGSRGAGGFAAMVLGSVSRYVASRAPSPVVVVREESMAVHREIAVGVRDPQDTGAALAFAFEEAALRDADLVAVHTWSWYPSSAHRPAPGTLPTDLDWISAEAASGLAATLKGWTEKYPGVRVRQDVIHGHPARVLASYSARADLVVLGRHGHPDGSGPGIGSVQHAVLDHAHGPVAIIPSGDRGQRHYSPGVSPAKLNIPGTPG
jgi:nucleotide-binding universal stress UspA family protein